MIRRRLAAVVLFLVSGALCGALASGRPARAEGEGEAGGIEGTLLNATTGLPAWGGRSRCTSRAGAGRGASGGGGGGGGGGPGGGGGGGGGRRLEARDTVADGDGRFAFAGDGAGARYQLTAVHQGVAYQPSSSPWGSCRRPWSCGCTT